MITVFYRAELGFLKSKGLRWLWQAARRLRTGTVGQPRDFIADVIREHARGRSFADIGCMWRVNGRWSFFAEECGATRVTAHDIVPPTEEFDRERARRRSSVAFVQGDINDDETVRRIGVHDVLFFSGVLFHCPNPLWTLSKLRALCGQTLILNTMSVPEMPGLRNALVFYPFLDASQRRIWDIGIGRQTAITTPFSPEAGCSNWLWGFTPSCLASLLSYSGFSVVYRRVRPFHSLFVARAV